MLLRLRLAAVLGVLVMAIAVGWWAPRHGAAQAKFPPDFTFDQAKDSPGPVTFSHERHKAAGAIEKCTTCHTKVFKMKKGQSDNLTMAKMNAGESCGTCHNGKTQVGGKVVFATSDKATCGNCHKKS
jgi:c(7)-type cytochrome triheme protein